MGRQWRAGMPGGVATALQGIANMGSQMRSIGANIPSFQQHHCDYCGALVQDNLWTKHQMFHQELARTVQQLAGSVGMAMHPLMELRQAIEEIDVELAKKNTKVIPRPRNQKVVEQGYVKPRRSGNPQSTISLEIPSVSASGDIFVYDAQRNKLIPVNGPAASTNLAPQQSPSMPTEPQCEGCGKYGPHMNDYATRKNSKGREILIATCEPCYKKSRPPVCETCGTTTHLTSLVRYNENGHPENYIQCQVCRPDGRK